ncbi:MAG: NAD(P)-dependent oxidoreductase [Selenomonadaceae bacterium]|nr:NAD(P)-dependent oxidoreductase [Selenomonadaceae bacterium]
MKNAILTGATGFVGRHLLKTLVRHGIKVTAVVRNEDKQSVIAKIYPDVLTVVCPLEEICNLPEVIGTAKPDTVFYHLAWDGTAGETRSDYKLQLRNVEYTVDSLKAAIAMHCEGYVGAGSLMEYESTAAVYDGDNHPRKANIYSTAKLTAHYMSKILSANEKIRYVWPYITNAYGEDELSPRFLNTTVRKIMAGEEMRFSAATQLYDFVYIDDVAKAFYRSGEKGINGRAYCVGSGYVKPLKEFIIEIRDIIRPDYRLFFGNSPGICLDDKYFDITSLTEDTGFYPKIDFRCGISKLADAYRRTS